MTPKDTNGLEMLRRLVNDRHSWESIRQDEQKFAEFMESWGKFLERGDKLDKEFDKLKMEFNDLSLVHEAILDHATNIENELELYNRVIADDLGVARQVQRALLPELTGTIASQFEMAIFHKQLAEVGGDYYDFFVIRDRDERRADKPAIGVYDISGHGVSSALIMAFLKAQFAHASTTEGLTTPSAIVEWVNTSAYSFLRGVRRYATVNFVVFGKGFLRYVCGGGHGLLVRRENPRVFNRVSNFIGLRKRPFHEFELPFEHDDVLALYTDGMFEAQDTNGKGYSVQRLNEMIVQHRSEPVQKILERCVDDYQSFRVADADDMTLIILRRCAS